jgi:hypothetical protein
MVFFVSLYYDAFSVTRLHSVDDRTNIHALSGIRTHGLSVQVIKAYAKDNAATGSRMMMYALVRRELEPVRKVAKMKCVLVAL